ncbi:MAG: pyridoxal phosphate-dependent aminotransferase [Hyphomicrobiaceae bacterium]|nr:pyridoxal phosphate-dependent aminotransferase [Hyphomicrobiaceae bacterium]
MTATDVEAFLAPRMARFVPSITNATSQRAREMIAAGIDVIRLSSGEPDFSTPPHIGEAAIAAIRAGFTHNTNIDGMPELKEAVARKFERENDLHYSVDEIGVATGSKQIIFNALMATVGSGDEVLIPTPYWVSYPDMVQVAGGTPVFVPTRPEKGFVLDAADLEAAITPRTKWLIINNPGNPSGAVWDRESLRQIADVIARHPHVWVMTDDIYEHLVYDNAVVCAFAAVAPELKPRTLTVNGLSKAYCMTGWRIGFAGGPKGLISAIRKLQSQETSNPNSIAQHAAVAALDGPKEFMAENNRRFKARRDLVVSRLDACPGLSCRMPRGAFYAFADCTALLGKSSPGGHPIETDVDFCEYVLTEHHVALVPGTAFGMPGHVRLSYAASEQELEEACIRIARAVEQLG